MFDCCTSPTCISLLGPCAISLPVVRKNIQPLPTCLIAFTLYYNFTFSNQIMQSLHDTAVGPTQCLHVHKARVPRQKRQRCRAALPDSGDQNVQNRLVDVIRLQIGQEKVRDFVQSEQDKLRQTAEEVRRRDCRSSEAGHLCKAGR